MSKKIHNIYNQPAITEVAPGQIEIDSNELAPWQADMQEAKDEWDATMVGAENDPKEILRRMMASDWFAMKMFDGE